MKSNDDLDGFINSVVQGSLISVSGNDQVDCDHEEIEEDSVEEEAVEVVSEDSAAESGDENEEQSETVTYSTVDYSDRFTNIENSQYVLCAELLAIILLIGILTGLKRL